MPLYLWLTGTALCRENEIKQFAPAGDIRGVSVYSLLGFLPGSICRDVPWFALVLKPQRGCGSAGMAPLQLLVVSSCQPWRKVTHPRGGTHPTSVPTASTHSSSAFGEESLSLVNSFVFYILLKQPHKPFMKEAHRFSVVFFHI